MSKRLLDYDKQTGVATYHAYDSENEKTIIETVSDVQPLMDINHKARSNQTTGWKGEMHHVASIPPVVYEAWWKELGSDPFAKHNRAWLIARLNNKDWAKLRTKDGRL